MRRLVAVPLAAVLVGVATACEGAARAFGPSPAAARTHADDFLNGLAYRVVDVQRAPRFAAARGKLARHALSPSRLWPDTSVWTGTAAATRTLELEGRFDGRRYAFAVRPGAPAPSRPGDSRHVVRLAAAGDGEWLWNTAVEQAVGRVRAADVAEALTATIAGLARPSGDFRPMVRAGLPRTSAALGRLLTLQQARSTPLADGSHLVELRSRFDAARLRPTMPALAEYVRKWVHPSRVALALTDPRGAARWLELTIDDDVLVLRLRARADGALLALDGPARPMPDTVQLRTDARVRYLMWDVGVGALVGDLATVRTANERGWTVRWTRPPRWHIPLGVRHLMSSTLDRPFARDGMLLRLTLRDSEAGQTLLVRRFDVGVKESAIVRWLGGLGFRAMDDFAGRVEREENRFLAEALQALRADLAATW